MKKNILCLMSLFLTVPSVFAGSITGKVDVLPAKALKETIVYLKDAPNTAKPKKTTMDQKKLQFLPHILPIVAGDSVEFTSKDSVIHDVVVTDLKTKSVLFTLVTPPGAPSVVKPFPTADIYHLTCHFHLDMSGYIFVGSNSYMAVVDEKTGQYTINDVPPGTYKIAVWNPKVNAADQSVTVTADKPGEVNFSLSKAGKTAGVKADKIPAADADKSIPTPK